MTPDPAQPDPSQQPQSQPPAKKKRHRARNWLIGIGVVLLLLILLVLLAPMLLGTAHGRAFVAAQIGNQLNGRAEIASLSLGWTSPTAVRGLRIYDDKDRLVLEVTRLETQLTVLDAIRGRLNFGETEGDVVLAIHVDEEGTSNVQRLARERPEPQPDEPITLPDLSGNFTLNYRGTVEGPGVPAPIIIEPSTAVLAVADINSAIRNDIKLTYRVGDGAAGTIALVGEAEVVSNNQLDLAAPRINEQVTLTNVDTGGLAPFIALVSPDLHTAGVLNGGLHLAADGTADVTVAGELAVTSFELGGPALVGDTFSTSRLVLPIKASRTMRDGAQYVQIETLRVAFDQGQIDITANAPQQTLLDAAQAIPAAVNAMLRQPSDGERVTLAGDGNLTVIANLDLAAIAQQLPNLIKLHEDTQLETGRLTHSTNAVFRTNSAELRTTTEVTDVTGTRDGQPVRLEPIHVELGGVALAGERPQMRDIAVNLTSGFATMSGGGESLEQLAVNGSFDLARMQQQAEQFVNVTQLLGGEDAAQPVVLAGTGTFELTTRGDLLAETAIVAAASTLRLEQISIAGVGPQPIRQEQLTLVAQGHLVRGKDDFFDQIRQAVVTLTTGSPQSPVIDAQLNADVNLVANTVPRFELVKLNIANLAIAQEQFGALVPALAENGIDIVSGQMYTNAAGSFDGTRVSLAKPLTVSVRNFSVNRLGTGEQPRPILRREHLAINLAGVLDLPTETRGVGGEFTALAVKTESDLLQLTKVGERPLVFSTTPAGAVQGNGQVRLASNLRRLNDVIQGFGQVAVPDPQSPRLESGVLDTTLALATAEQTGTTINIDGKIDRLTIAAHGGQPIANETITIAIRSQSPPDLSSLTANGKIGSSFATATLSDTRLLLETTRNGESVSPGMWDTVRSANVEVQAPDLPKLHALIQALAPPEAQLAADTPATPASVPPLELIRGSASLKLALAREPDKQLTTLNISELLVRDLALRRGQQQYAFEQGRDLRFVLAADVAAADDPAVEQTLTEQIRSIRVRQLEGDLVVATVKMPEPIVVTNLATTPRAAGAIASSGQLERLTPLLAVLQGGEPLPYGGAFQLTQRITSEGDLLTLIGDLTADDFRVFDAADRAQVVFHEKQVRLQNNIAADFDKSIAKINQLSLAMPQSEALGLDAKGRIEDWQSQRRLDLKLDVAYDLERLWPIIHPMLVTAGEEDPYADLKVAGKHRKTFTLAGSYPDAPTYQESIRHLVGGGEISVDRLVTSGFDIANKTLVLKMKDGQVHTEAPQPAECNGGQLQLGGLALDLTRDVPRLWSVKNNRIIRGASINPLLGDTLGKFVNPVFANSTRAQGLLDLTIVQCHNLALGEAMKTPQSGTARFVFSLSDMDIANPIGSLVLGAIPVINFNVGKDVAETFRGQIRDAVVTIDKGVTTQDITMEIIDPSRAADVVAAKEPVKPEVFPLRFQGNVQLADLSQSITFTLPRELLAKWTSDRVVQFLPEGLPLAFHGTTVTPKIDTGNIARQIAEAQIRARVGGEMGDLLGGLRRGDQPPPQQPQKPQQDQRQRPPPGEQPQTQPTQPEDPLGGLLRGMEQLQRDREQRREREKRE